MNTNIRLPHDIAIVGLGLAGVHQITHEVEETIRRSHRLFITDMAVGVIEYLKTLCPLVTDLTSRGEIGTHRMLIYRRMASEVVAAALEQAPVCFASYGHPNLYCYPTTLIQRAAQILDLRTVVLPGISSLDTLMSDLAIDPGSDGLQVYEATDLLIRHRPLQPDVGCVIFQAPIVLEALNRPGKRSGDNLQVLQSYLLKFYPGRHMALFVTSRTHPLLESIIQRFPIERLAETLLNNSTMGTIYIPPIHHREIAEEELAERMTLHDPEPTTRPAYRPGRPSIGPKPPGGSGG